MGFKEILKQTFDDKKDITTQRCKAAKFAFIISSFLFFISFYSIGARFYLDFFTNTLGITYIILLLSLFFYIYFFIKHLFIGKISAIFFVLVGIVLLLILGFLLFPLIVDGGFKGVFELINNLLLI